MGNHLKLELPPDPKSVAAARRAVERLAERLPEGVAEDLRLVVSELATNAYRHVPHPAGTSISVRIEVSEDKVWGEVIDSGPGFVPPRGGLPGGAVVSGRGLQLVDRVVDRWGVKRNDDTHVWFEIDLGEGRA